MPLVESQSSFSLKYLLVNMLREQHNSRIRMVPEKDSQAFEK